MQFHATPYDITATGFYFSTAEEFEAKAKAHRNEAGDPVEEYEIQFIDGDATEAEMMVMIGDRINQANLEEMLDWMDEVTDWPDQALAGLAYAFTNLGEPFETVKDMTEDEAMEKVRWSFGELKAEDIALTEYAQEIIEETGQLAEVPENLRNYIDYEALGRDMRLGGEVTVFDYNGETYIMDNLA